MSPRFLTISFSLILGVEYLGRFIFLRPRNYLWIGKALANFSVSFMYVIFEIYSLPKEFGHSTSQYINAFYFGYMVYYLIIEYIQKFRGGLGAVE